MKKFYILNQPPEVQELMITVNGTSWSNTLESYGGSQDKPEAVVTYKNNSSEVQIKNNSWKSFDLGNYNVTPNTVLTFDFLSSEQGEIQGIGFDTDNSLSRKTAFQLYGTQTWGNQAFNNYKTGQDWKTYSLNVGAFFTGSFDRLVFVNDNDTADNLGSSSQFRNIVLEEST
ncbi:MAG: hypothetical protein WBM32_16895 [Crocosphaera sp.]